MRVSLSIFFLLMAGIYIHIPFCKQACHYCDFHFSTNQALAGEMTEAIARELALQRDYLEGEEIRTIYFGGGTPSLLGNEQLRLILNAIDTHQRVAADTEITLEGNPDDLTPEKLHVLKALGFNRLSIGIQSFDNNVLSFLNRAHNASSAIQCVTDARVAGFTNISIDLIYAIPGQTEEAWVNNIRQALLLNPEHISSYSLTIEEKTAFGKWAAAGKLHTVEDDRAAQQLETLMRELSAAGFDQYEVSNFGKPGYWSRHNSSYWQQEKYLGVGPSAHSFNGPSRQYNIRSNHLYLKALNDGNIPFEKELLSREDRVNEFLLTTLRTSWGCNLATLKAELDYDLPGVNADYLKDLLTRKLAIIKNDYLILTAQGRLLADKISSDLFVVPPAAD